jgi:hypothetical protein
LCEVRADTQAAWNRLFLVVFSTELDTIGDGAIRCTDAHRLPRNSHIEPIVPDMTGMVCRELLQDVVH